MDKRRVSQIKEQFDLVVHKEEQVKIEFWYARELQDVLEYTEWRNFKKVIDKAKIACDNSGNSVEDHFVDINKMVQIGSGADRIVDDIQQLLFAFDGGEGIVVNCVLHTLI